MLKYDQESPVQPRFDLNAPDLYIPCMGYVTYVLLTGFVLGRYSLFNKLLLLMFCYDLAVCLQITKKSPQMHGLL
jgi:hypothetical protein